MNHRSIRRTRPRMAAACAAALVLGAAGCGNLTAGGFTEVTVAVSGDAPDPTPAAQPAPLARSPAAPTTGALPTSHEAEAAEGEVEIDFTLGLVSEAGTVTPLGTDDIRIRLDLQGLDEAEAVRELVPAVRYAELRITFTHIKVEVEGGLVIDGQEIVGEVRVELDEPELLVTRPLDLDATQGGAVELVVDLNAPAWLAALDPLTQTVDASAFADLVDLVVR